MHKAIAAACLFVWICLAESVEADVPRLAATVARVIDGDTLWVNLPSGPIRVRLSGIDAPEQRQPGGKESSAALAHLVLNRHVEIEPVRQDRYERMVGRLYFNHRDIAAELIAAGHVWAYRRYLRQEEAYYCGLEQSARQARRGLWAEPVADWIPPWRWRKAGNARDSSSTYPLPTEASCRQELGRSSVSPRSTPSHVSPSRTTMR